MPTYMKLTAVPSPDEVNASAIRQLQLKFGSGQFVIHVQNGVITSASRVKLTQIDTQAQPAEPQFTPPAAVPELGTLSETEVEIPESQVEAVTEEAVGEMPKPTIPPPPVRPRRK